MGRPRQIGDIQPYAELFQGATTIVYKGFQASLDRFVLLKVLRPEFCQDEDLARRFEEEARLAAQIQHPNVVAVYGYGRDQGCAYFAAEFIEGTDLEALTRGRPLPPELAALVLLETARGLKAAHDRGILHRDLKPSNVLVSREGQVKITDFGMASLADPVDAPAGEVRGTLAYLAPEQVLGQPPVVSSDLFSLGLTFFALLTGRAAFEAADAGTLFDQILHVDPVQEYKGDVEIPTQLRRICQQLLKKKPEQRYQDAGVVIADLEALRASHGTQLVANTGRLQAYLEDPDAYLPPSPEPARISSTKATPRANATRPTAPRPAPVKPAHRGRLVGMLGLAAVAVVAVVLIGQWAGSLRSSFDDTGGASSPSGEERRSPPPEHAESGAPPPSSTASPGDAADSNSDSGGQEAPREQPVPGANAPVGDAAATGAVSTDAARDSAAAPQGTTPAVPDSAGSDSVQAPPDSSGVLPVHRRPGYLRVVCVPWAVVYVDGDSIGVTPLDQAIALDPGTHAVTLEHPDFPPYELDLEAVPGQEETLEVSLWDTVGTLLLEVSPWADVYIDGVYRDKTPISQDRPLVVAPGEHTLRLEHPSLGVYETTFTIDAGEELPLRHSMRDSPPD